MSTAAPTSEPVTPGTVELPAIEQLPDDPAVLKQMILELLATLQEERRDKDALRHRLDLLLRRLYGPRGERFDPNQTLLFGDAAEPQNRDTSETQAPASEEAESSQPRRRARPHGRRRLPVNLERRPVHHELTESERLCACGHVRVDIGADVSEQLDYQPASLFVRQHFVHKYVCPQCAQRTQTPVPTLPEPTIVMAEPSTGGTTEQPVAAAAAPAETTTVVSPPQPQTPIIAAAKPATPIARGLPGAGLLAYIIISKYLDHLPLYRLERICAHGKGCF